MIKAPVWLYFPLFIFLYSLTDILHAIKMMKCSKINPLSSVINTLPFYALLILFICKFSAWFMERHSFYKSFFHVHRIINLSFDLWFSASGSLHLWPICWAWMPLFQPVVLKIKRDHKKAERERESYLDLVDKMCHDSRRKSFAVVK